MTNRFAAIVASLVLWSCGGGPRTTRPAAPARSAEPVSWREVVERHLARQGGRDRLAALAGIRREGTISMTSPSGELRGAYRTCVAYPGAGYVEIDAGPMIVAEAIDGGKAVVCARGFQDCRDAPADKAAELAATAREANRELLFEVERWSGTPSLRETPARWELEVVDAREGPTAYAFDRGSGLLAEKRRGAKTRRYEDWRSIDGVVIPFRITDTIEGGPTIAVTLDRAALLRDGERCAR